MSINTITDDGLEQSPPRGKVLGVATKEQFEEVAKGLQDAGFKDIGVYRGTDGAHILERIKGFMLSDSEGEVLLQHIKELYAGNLIFEIKTSSDRVREIARVASEHGAKYLMHFGFWGVTWLQA